MDPFGHSGTTARVFSELGYQAHFLNRGGITPGIRQRRLNGCPAKLWCGHGGQIPLEPAHGRAGRAGNYNICLIDCVWHPLLRCFGLEGDHVPVNLARRFSIKAAMPSFWSSVANKE